MTRTFQTPTEYEIMIRECMKLSRAFPGNPKNSQELSGILGTLKADRKAIYMHATQMKHAANLEVWKERIMDCRASGLTVREWCS